MSLNRVTLWGQGTQPWKVWGEGKSPGQTGCSSHFASRPKQLRQQEGSDSRRPSRCCARSSGRGYRSAQATLRGPQTAKAADIVQGARCVSRDEVSFQGCRQNLRHTGEGAGVRSSG